MDDSQCDHNDSGVSSNHCWLGSFNLQNNNSDIQITETLSLYLKPNRDFTRELYAFTVLAQIFFFFFCFPGKKNM